ncbi:oxalurate catabolism protein HpxZ [Pseudoxanthobacter sp. M-2]|uniref:oxalurate catabolism protein HpxZ n=1 Tax=Pseudoxanthobacter sp. M-2 TaxID=3078754 RepID=UPI0038FCE77E
MSGGAVLRSGARVAETTAGGLDGDGPEINRLEVVAEVRAAFERYERALVERDFDTLDEQFWDGAPVVRFGIAENQYGPEVIGAWRRVAPVIHPSRRLSNTVVTTFGTDFATVSTEFRSDVQPGLVGRQMQTWVRFPGGWRVVAAHVSTIADEG